MQQAQEIGDAANHGVLKWGPLRAILTLLIRSRFGHAPERPQNYFRLAARRPRRVLYWGVGAAYVADEAHGVIIGICPSLFPRSAGLDQHSLIPSVSPWARSRPAQRRRHPVFAMIRA
jgi:hypothetical protein